MSVTLDFDEPEPIAGLREDGRPEPAYAVAVGILPAPIARRVGAFAIDAGIVVFLTLPILLGAIPAWAPVISANPRPSSWMSEPTFRVGLIFYIVGQGLVTVFMLVQLIVHGVRGRTVGKKLLGIRTVNVARFDRPGFGWIVLRAFVQSTAFSIVPFLGIVPFLLSPLWDPERRGRGWHDRMTRVWLIDVKTGLDPFDAKRLRHARKAADAPERPVAAPLPSLATGTESSETAFVPSARSSSGVISALPEEGAGKAWEPPPIGPVTVPQIAAESSPAAPPVTAEPARQTPPIIAARVGAALLQFDDGTVVEAEGGGLIGRNPELRSGEEAKPLRRLVDPQLQLSKTHLEYGQDSDDFWVVDRGSANGTTVTTPAGVTSAVQSQTRTVVDPGSVVSIGGRSFTVTTKDGS